MIKTNKGNREMKQKEKIHHEQMRRKEKIRYGKIDVLLI